MEHQDLYQKSIDIILEYQSPSGAYVASPNFPTYGYSWLRDSSYIAAAMVRVGKSDSARKYHRWVDQVIRRYRDKIAAIHKALASGQALEDMDFLFTRYSLEGFEDRSDESWGNFQYDGYGTWLWSLWEYYRLTRDKPLVNSVWQSVRDVLGYLCDVWQLPAYDCWEEHPDLIHPYSLACVYGGFSAALKLAEACDLPLDESQIQKEMLKVRQFTLDNGVCEGHLVKHIHHDPSQNPYCDSDVDSSLLGALVPYALPDPDSGLAEATLQIVREKLVSESGGVHRYLKDTYYGGGTWILLTAWLGWVEAVMGDRIRAHARLDWILSQADAQGWLAEQMTDEVLYPEMVQPWQEKWGSVASPLLWSHAMYLILQDVLQSGRDTGDD
jgi:GH15 family glucan-1,4-alpha-glucosidase